MSASQTTRRLKAGDPVPAFSLMDQDGNVVRPEDFTGSRLFVFFYPKANTSG